MKAKIAILALIQVAAAAILCSSAHAKLMARSEEAQAASSAEPARSVWDGVYTEEQATRGEALVAQKCAHCHGSDLSGGDTAPALNSAGFKANWNGLSINYLFDRIKVSMPQDYAGSLSLQQTADILAFLFSKLGFPKGQTELASTAEVLKPIRFEENKPGSASGRETPSPLETISVTSASSYHVITRIAVPGNARWDYITADSEGRRLYIPDDIEVIVLDLDSGAVVGKITDLKGVHGVAVAREFGRGFISASDPGSITMFDLDTLAVLDKVRVGDDPNEIIYDPKTGRVFTADRGGKRLTAIDAKTGKVAGTVENLAGVTKHLAADEAGHIFLTMQDAGELHKIDAQALMVMETWRLTPPCGQPSTMDMDRAHNRIFVVCGSGLFAVVDGMTGKIIASQTIGLGADALEFDPKMSLIYVPTGAGDGALSIFHQESADRYTLVKNVKTLPGARIIALDQKTGKLYLPVADFGPPPAATSENLRSRPQSAPGSFSVLVIGQ